MTSPAAALIETMRVRNGSVPLWPLHRDRLRASAAALGLTLPNLDPPSGGADRVVRWELGAAGLTATERAVGSAAPLRLHLAAVPHRPYPHKTTARVAFDAAVAETARAAADEPLLLTAEGLVAEAANWSVFWWEEGMLCAPPLELGILPSVARRRLVAEMGLPLRTRRVGAAGLRDRSLFLANAGRGVVPVARLGSATVPGEPQTARLAAAFWP